MPPTTNVLQFAIDDSGHATIRYVDEAGARVTFDLTEYIDSRAKAAVDEHMKKYHGHQL